MRTLLATTGAAALLAFAACSTEPAPIEQTYGPDPQFPEPQRALLPTLNEATAVGWAQDAGPVPAEGLTVSRFADGLAHPRWLYVLPNGDVLLAESASEPSDPKGLRGWIEQRVMKNAGAVEQSPNHILLLRDADRDGVAELRDTFLSGLKQPHGMVLLNGYLYIGNTDSLVRVPYRDGDTKPAGPVETVTPLPYNPEDNGHWPRNVVAAPDGSTLYVAAGSVSNVGEAGMEVERDRAAIHTVNPATGEISLFADGLRNPNGMDFTPDGTLWTVVNERDELGDNLVPDYLTSVRQGGFYGWPWSYFGQHLDPRFDEDERPMDRVQAAIAPDYALGAHTASLGLVFNDGPALGPQFQGGAFIGQHGSWNRSEPSGYKVIYVPFAGGRPSGAPVDVLTGFLNENEEAQGRPVGGAIAADGALLVADDVGEVVWRVTPAAGLAPMPVAVSPGAAPTTPGATPTPGAQPAPPAQTPPTPEPEQ